MNSNFIYVFSFHIPTDNGQRSLVMNDNFFVGYRKTILKADEVLISLHIPYTSHVSIIGEVSISPHSLHITFKYRW